jgi:hypothetical protein
MNLATLCIGKDYCKQYSKQLTHFGNKLTVCTDHPEYFWSNRVVVYRRDEFSYYEKLTLLFSLILQEQNRVTYVDVDYLSDYKSIDYDSSSFYSYGIFDHSKFSRDDLNTDAGTRVMLSLYDQLGVNVNKYPHERLLSAPYDINSQYIYDRLVEMRPLFEYNFPKGKDWGDHRFTRFAKRGSGYGEGAALAAISDSIEIKFKKHKHLLL